MAYKPTAGMVEEAKRGLAWRRDGDRGGTAVGLARARDISNNKQLPLKTVKRMYSFFARHEVDKKAKGFRPGEEGYPSPGRVAWALWGGDAGFTWSKGITEREKKTKSVESAMLPDMDETSKGQGHSSDDAMTHLLMAYRQMMEHPGCWGLLTPLMDLVHQLQDIMIEPAEEEMADEEMAEEHDGEVAYVAQDGGYGQRRRRKMAKVITEEDGQYCVRSEGTNRLFGCYGTMEQANDRMEQIDSFSADKLVGATTNQLTDWFANGFRMEVANPAFKTVHELIGDELAVRASSRNLEAKMAHLGPVYVPGWEDAHGEFTDEKTLQKALWSWVRKDDRNIYLQHSAQVAGEMVEMLTWPFELETSLSVPNQGVTKYTFPPETPFMGVVWEPWAWDLVKKGELRGYSIGGSARRMEAELPA